ncbi:MAG: STAS domain-containing protein [Pseudomonadota bacterium]
MLKKSGNGILKLTLSGECTIAEVESDTDKMRSRFAQGQVDGVEISFKDLVELDTAYFQLILSLRATAHELGVPFKLTNDSPALAEAAELYGIVF